MAAISERRGVAKRLNLGKRPDPFLCRKCLGRKRNRTTAELGVTMHRHFVEKGGTQPHGEQSGRACHKKSDFHQEAERRPKGRQRVAGQAVYGLLLRKSKVFSPSAAATISHRVRMRRAFSKRGAHAPTRVPGRALAARRLEAPSTSPSTRKLPQSFRRQQRPFPCGFRQNKVAGGWPLTAGLNARRGTLAWRAACG